MKTKLKERHLYFYTCTKCNHINRSTFKRSRARIGVCRNCRRLEVNKDQLLLI